MKIRCGTATVSSERIFNNATGVMNSGKAENLRRPASQETCMDAMQSSRRIFRRDCNTEPDIPSDDRSSADTTDKQQCCCTRIRTGHTMIYSIKTTGTGIKICICDKTDCNKGSPFFCWPAAGSYKPGAASHHSAARTNTAVRQW